MYTSREKGDIGEEAAINYLLQNGYEILERNFSTRFGEIDIIGRDRGCTVFIEVKSRRDLKKGLPCEAVNHNKQHRIARMAMLYIIKNKLQDMECRFDVIEILINNSTVSYLRLIKDAFQVDE